MNIDYQDVQPIDHHEAQRIFMRGDATKVPSALLRAALHDTDWQWIQRWCLRFVTYEDLEVRRIAILCLGHIARIHRAIDIKKVVPILLTLTNDADLGGVAEDVLDDIQTFV